MLTDPEVMDSFIKSFMSGATFALWAVGSFLFAHAVIAIADRVIEWRRGRDN